MTPRHLIPFLLLFPVSAYAQTPVPVTATSGFSVTSADHAATNADGTPVITSYEVRFLPGTGCAAVAPENEGKPPLVGGIVTLKPVAALGTLTANCTYTATVAAIGPGGTGVSAPSAPFVRVVPKVPAAPSVPVILP